MDWILLAEEIFSKILDKNVTILVELENLAYRKESNITESFEEYITRS